MCACFPRSHNSGTIITAEKDSKYYEYALEFKILIIRKNIHSQEQPKKLGSLSSTQKVKTTHLEVGS